MKVARMRNRLFRWIDGILLSLPLAVLSFIVVGCGEKEDVAGGVTEDSGIVADIAGVFQKGPFVEGSPVKVSGVDCKTLTPTGEIVGGEIANGRGEFSFEKLTLSTPCAIFEVTGHYLNEVTGLQTTDKFTLRAVTMLSERNSVNVNLFTHMEYERVVHLVTESDMAFDNAKEQAEKEVLATFGIEDEVGEFEDLDIFKPGDGNAALLAASVMMQADDDVEGLARRLESFNASFAGSGVWEDDVKTEMAEWASAAVDNGLLDRVRENIESWNMAVELPDFEDFVERFEDGYESGSEIISSGFDVDWNLSKEARMNPEVEYDSVVDARDGKVYRTVKIGEQVWMAENLNYADSVSTPGLAGRSWCFGDRAENCEVAGRLYTWAAAIDSVGLASDAESPQRCGYGRICSFSGKVQGICPSGWHLPDTTEWNTLLETASGPTALMSRVGWYVDHGTDEYGFSAFPAGSKYRNSYFFSDSRNADYFAVAENADKDDGTMARYMSIGGTTYFVETFKDNGVPVRCLKD